MIRTRRLRLSVVVRRCLSCVSNKTGGQGVGASGLAVVAVAAVPEGGGSVGVAGGGEGPVEGGS